MQPGVLRAWLDVLRWSGNDWVCFFFSSRRRHTRWPRDWSSDVCSSDLRRKIEAITRTGRQENRAERKILDLDDRTEGEDRSEERRVGKESRCRRGREQ